MLFRSDTFGFRGGEFGNWMNQNDRQASLNMGFEALKDLAAALQVSDRDIAYQGTLAIAFGARGSGNAAAHYEPLRKVINLTKMQEAVGGGIEGYYPYAEPVAIVCNDEGKINELPLNRAIYNQDGEMIEIMAGTFFIAGLGEESFADLPDHFMEQYKEQFKYPEKFYRLAGEIVAVKQPLPPEEKQQPAPVMEEPGGDDIRLDESMDLAFDLDEFFRQNSGAYADLYPDSHAEKERIQASPLVV